MADQVEVPKSTTFVITGSATDQLTGAKVVMYLILEPGEIEAGDTTRQSHISAQVIRRS